MSELQVPIRIKRGVGGAPSQLLRGELAFNESQNELYIGKGASGSNDASGRPIAATVEQLLAPAQFLSALSDVAISSGLNDGDVLTFNGTSGEWIAQAVAAASVAWADVTGKPSVFTPDTHTHAWGDITSGVPSTFAPSAHKASHATGGTDAIAPADIGAAAASHTHGSITNDGKIGSTAGLPVVTGSAGAVTALALGTAGQVLRVNAAADGVEFGTTAGESVGWADVTDKPTTFTPSAHKASHATGGADALSPSDIGAIPSSEKGANSGVATLDAGGKLNTAQLPNLAITSFLGNAANEAAMLALTGQEGDWAIRTDTGAVWIITGATPSSIGSWTQLSYPAAPVSSVNGETGTVVLDHTDVGAAAASHTHDLTDAYVGQIDTPTAKDYVLDLNVAAGRTITALYFITASGTVDVTLKNGANTIYTADGLGSTKTSVTSGLSNATFSAGGTLTLTIDAVSTPADLQFSIVYTRTTGAIS